MNLIEPIVLGTVQGLTEFLPISSSAHLVLVPFFLGWTDPGLAFDVALHVGTLCAILIFFRREWVEILEDLVGTRRKSGVTWKLLVIGTIPGMVAGLLVEKQAEEFFRNPLLIAATLSLFAILLWYWDSHGKKNRSLSEALARDALIVGLAQALAIVPGVSRSGVTITAALFVGLERSSAVRFSFLLSAPIIGGAGILKAPSIFTTLAAGGSQAVAVLLGFATSLFAGLVAIGFLTTIARTRTFNGFVVYRLLLAAVIVATVLLRG